MKIGCMGIVYDDVKKEILGLDCAKGRGITLPGGKFEPQKDRTYMEASAREVFEETGVIVNSTKGILWHHGLGGTGKFYLYTYLFTKFDDSCMQDTREGKPIWMNINVLLKQDTVFAPVFHIIFDNFYERIEDVKKREASLSIA